MPDNSGEINLEIESLLKERIIIQDGKPYILSVKAGPAFENQRNQGFTVAAISTFASVEDFEYYDTQCQAHLALKAVAKTLNKGVMMIYFTSIV